METIGEKIKRLRKSKGLRQIDVALVSGITQPSYASIERGETKMISIEVGKGISKALNISFMEIFDIPISLKDTEVEDTEIAELRKQIIKLRKKIEELNRQNDKNEKMISLQDQINQNFKNAIFEANYYAGLSRLGELINKIDNKDYQIIATEIFYSYTQEFVKKLIDWGCFSEKEFELFNEKKRDFSLSINISKQEEGQLECLE